MTAGLPIIDSIFCKCSPDLIQLDPLLEGFSRSRVTALSQHGNTSTMRQSVEGKQETVGVWVFQNLRKVIGFCQSSFIFSTEHVKIPIEDRFYCSGWLILISIVPYCLIKFPMKPARALSENSGLKPRFAREHCNL